MKITPAQGGVRLRLDAAESDTLAAFVSDLVEALQPDGLAPDDPVRQRLFPDGYHDDPEAAAAFRSLTEQSLHAERLGRAQQCLADLAGLAETAGTYRRRELILPADAAQRWLQVLNDLRLAIGTRLGVSEDDEALEIDPTDPQSLPRASYAYLTALQDSLVRALMKGA